MCEKAPFVVAFEEYCSKALVPFIAACSTLGGGAAQGVSIAQIDCRSLLALTIPNSSLSLYHFSSKTFALFYSLNISQGTIVQKAWDAQLHFLTVASKCKKPDDMKLLLVPLQECLKEAGAACKRDEWENHAKTISEGLGPYCFLIQCCLLPFSNQA